MGNKLELKSVKDMLDNNFFIPAYQRGYRWGEQQVNDLLNDIWEFSQYKIKDEFYPLQPIVVFRNIENNKNYEVIDGQQRITTIYIIFKYLRDLTKLFENKQEEINNLKDIFGFCLGNIENLKNKIELKTEIKYETRDEEYKSSQDFLKNDIAQGLNTTNPDFYYMSNTYETVKKWFQTNSISLDLFVDTLKENTQVIWYEIDANESERTKIFSRLNIGKIELTNAELIKALLLQDEQDYKKQIELGNELDKIEYALRNEKFWSFITEEVRDTKIDLIFELLADSYKKKYSDKYLDRIDKKYDNKYSFYIFEYILIKNKEKTKEDIFLDVKEYFRYLEEWYSDKEFYHKIGFLLTNKNSIKLLRLIIEYQKEDKTKSDFRYFLNEKIIGELKGIKISKLKYGEKVVKKVLLLFNIETIIQNENISYRFDFSKYKTGTKGWDIEHIRSQTDPDITGDKRDTWIKALFEVYGKAEEEIEKAQIKYKDDNRFEKFYTQVSKVLGEDESFDDDLKDSIGNLTLLDSTTNRGYGNAFFPIKRAIILNLDTKGRFIPPCTKNVFLKVYNKKISTMMSWDENDIKSYRCNIFKTLKKYLGVSHGN